MGNIKIRSTNEHIVPAILRKKKVWLARHIAREKKIADWNHFHRFGFVTAALPKM